MKIKHMHRSLYEKKKQNKSSEFDYQYLELDMDEY